MLIPIADLGIAKGPARPAPSPSAEPCLLCGRWVLGVKHMVEITTSGCVVWPGDGTCASVPNSQGGFTVGPDCYRKLKAAARAKEAK